MSGIILFGWCNNVKSGVWGWSVRGIESYSNVQNEESKIPFSLSKLILFLALISLNPWGTPVTGTCGKSPDVP